MHTVHNSFDEQGQAFIKLEWRGEDFDWMTLPTMYMFPEVKEDDVKMYDFDTLWFKRDVLKDKIPAFSDDSTWKLFNIPKQFTNSKRLVSKNNFDTGHEDFIVDSVVQPIKFKINAAAKIYIAIDTLSSQKMDPTWTQIDQVITLIKIDQSDEKDMYSGEVEKIAGIDDVELVLFKKEFFDKGDVEISFNGSPQNVKWLIWMVANTNTPKYQCTAKE